MTVIDKNSRFLCPVRCAFMLKSNKAKHYWQWETAFLCNLQSEFWKKLYRRGGNYHSWPVLRNEKLQQVKCSQPSKSLKTPAESSHWGNVGMVTPDWLLETSHCSHRKTVNGCQDNVLTGPWHISGTALHLGSLLACWRLPHEHYSHSSVKDASGVPIALTLPLPGHSPPSWGDCSHRGGHPSLLAQHQNLHTSTSLEMCLKLRRGRLQFALHEGDGIAWAGDGVPGCAVNIGLHGPTQFPPSLSQSHKEDLRCSGYLCVVAALQLSHQCHPGIWALSELCSHHRGMGWLRPCWCTHHHTVQEVFPRMMLCH